MFCSSVSPGDDKDIKTDFMVQHNQVEEEGHKTDFIVQHKQVQEGQMFEPSGEDVDDPMEQEEADKEEDYPRTIVYQDQDEKQGHYPRTIVYQEGTPGEEHSGLTEFSLTNIPIEVIEEGDRGETGVYDGEGVTGEVYREEEEDTGRVYEEEDGDRRQDNLVHGKVPGRVENVVYEEKGSVGYEEEGERRERAVGDEEEGVRGEVELYEEEGQVKRETVVYEEQERRGGSVVYEEEERRGGSVVYEEEEKEERLSLAQQLELIQGQSNLREEEGISDHVISIEEDGQITIEQLHSPPPTFPEWWLRLSSTFLSFLSSGHLVDLWLVCSDGEAVPAHQVLL